MTATVKRAALVVLTCLAMTGCDVPTMIRAAFEARGATPTQQDEAVRVASCESGLNPSAKNGQYRGLFQMGHYHDHRPGMDEPFSPSRNATGAADLWAEQGWRPWACRP